MPVFYLNEVRAKNPNASGGEAVHSMPNRNLMKLKGTAKLKLQHHYMTPRESKFTQFEILPIQENFAP